MSDKVTITALVEKVSTWETEFNRKKVSQTGAYFKTASGEVFYWKTGNMPIEVKEGETVTLTGTVKEVFTRKTDGVSVMALLRCKIEGVEKPATTFTFFTDGKSRCDQIAVCGEDGRVLHYGPAGLGRPDNGDNTDHELAAVIMALRIAGARRAELGLKTVGVSVNVDAQWLVGMVGKAAPIRDFARQNGLLVKIEWVPGEENPADQWTTAAGSLDFFAPKEVDRDQVGAAGMEDALTIAKRG